MVFPPLVRFMEAHYIVYLCLAIEIILARNYEHSSLHSLPNIFTTFLKLAEV